jgi:hypothetical protein
MRRRNLLKFASAGFGITTLSAAVSADSSQISYKEKTAQEQVTTITETDREAVHSVSLDSDEYITFVDKETGAVKIKKLSEKERLDLGISDSRAISPSSAQNTEIDQQAATMVSYKGEELIERSSSYQRTIGSCYAGCSEPHIVDGTSMELHPIVADASQTLVTAAILSVLAAAAAGTGGAGAYAAAFFGSTTVEAVLGTVVSQFAGNSLTLGIWQWDQGYFIGSQKFTSGAYGLGEWQPGPDDLNRFTLRPGHGVNCGPPPLPDP